MAANHSPTSRHEVTQPTAPLRCNDYCKQLCTKCPSPTRAKRSNLGSRSGPSAERKRCNAPLSALDKRKQHACIHSQSRSRYHVSPGRRSLISKLLMRSSTISFSMGRGQSVARLWSSSRTPLGACGRMVIFSGAIISTEPSSNLTVAGMPQRSSPVPCSSGCSSVLPFFPATWTQTPVLMAEFLSQAIGVASMSVKRYHPSASRVRTKAVSTSRFPAFTQKLKAVSV
mmetsp:Transcript_20144/g.40872  ORF Transcript_20144/g.40872 Transcript_20144/m.40872 type:complete len:228 (-) Transcript_20144:373-1056(-)